VRGRLRDKIFIFINIKEYLEKYHFIIFKEKDELKRLVKLMMILFDRF